MRIGIVTGVFPPKVGGPSTQLFHLCKILERDGNIPIVITFGKRTEKKTDGKIQIYYIREEFFIPSLNFFLKYLFFCFYLYRIIKETTPDIIHCNDVQVMGFFTGLIINITHTPGTIKYMGDAVWQIINRNHLVVEQYEEVFNYNLKTKILAGFEKFIFSMFDVVWAPSKFQEQSLITFFNISQTKIVRFPNLINIKKYHKKKINDSSKIIILSVNRDTPWKKVENAIEIFSLLKISDKQIVLRIVGCNKSIQKKIIESGLENSIEVYGEISPESIATFFSDADIYLSSTIYEPFGIVFIEAMATGLPIVAPSVGGIPEIIEDGKTGFLYKPDDFVTAAEKLTILINNPGLRQQMSEDGHLHAECFDIENYHDYYQILHQKAFELNRMNK
jgi:glycosyltransferase involved in cell wall biosynthesis